MPLTLLDQSELLQLIRSRSRVGAEVLYDQYAKVLSLAIFHIVKQNVLTNMVLEKAICQIWDTADQYNEQELPFLPWMLGIARTLAKENIASMKLE